MEEEENDRLRHDSGEEMDGTWGGPDLVEVSEETHKLLTVACTQSVSNETRKRSHGHFPLPKVVATKSPNLDPFLRMEVPQNTKANDRELGKVQSFASMP